MKILKAYLHIVNSFEVRGKGKIPKEGAIFYVNHPGSLDVPILLAAFGKPIGVFVSYDNFYFLDVIEHYYGLINKKKVLRDARVSRRNRRDVLIELMIRNILKKNRYFAIWPSGSLSRSGKVQEGFSSVVRAYSVINAEKDRIPFVPVLIQGSQCYHIGVNPSLKPKFKKIRLSFLDPYYLPRKWLQKPEEGGKSPREIINYMMRILAKANGQKTFIKNNSLERARRHYRQRQEKKQKVKNHGKKR